MDYIYLCDLLILFLTIDSTNLPEMEVRLNGLVPGFTTRALLKEEVSMGAMLEISQSFGAEAVTIGYILLLNSSAISHLNSFKTFG